jgi:hypothetical protein
MGLVHAHTLWTFQAYVIISPTPCSSLALWKAVMGKGTGLLLAVALQHELGKVGTFLRGTNDLEGALITSPCRVFWAGRCHCFGVYSDPEPAQFHTQ